MSKSSGQIPLQQKQILTPIQKAKKRIKASYIAAFISAGITIVVSLLSLAGRDLFEGVDSLALIDGALVIILALLIMLIKSRIAAVILFIYFVFSKVLLIMDNPESFMGNFIVGGLFAIAFFFGIVGTISYHRLKKQDRAE